jgi:hypothetical protein
MPMPVNSAWTRLSGVVCLSTTDCKAVGSYLDSNEVKRTFAVKWNGTAWSIVTTPAPSEALASELSAISCPSSSACRAVGGYEDAEETKRNLALSWNGTAWSVVATPDPEGAEASRMSGVSCASATSCRAVGSYEEEEGGTVLPTSMTWNGTSWAVQAVPAMQEASQSRLKAVHCFSTTARHTAGLRPMSRASWSTGSPARTGSSATLPGPM